MKVLIDGPYTKDEVRVMSDEDFEDVKREYELRLDQGLNTLREQANEENM